MATNAHSTMTIYNGLLENLFCWGFFIILF